VDEELLLPNVEVDALGLDYDLLPKPKELFILDPKDLPELELDVDDLSNDEDLPDDDDLPHDELDEGLARELDDRELLKYCVG
jgi:hypothetical protein